MPGGAATDPDVLPRGGNGDALDPHQGVVVAHCLPAGTDVMEALAAAAAGETGLGVRHESQARLFRGGGRIVGGRVGCHHPALRRACRRRMLVVRAAPMDLNAA